MKEDTQKQRPEPRRDLSRQRRKTMIWGAVALTVALVVGALFAPNTTLLAFVLLAGLGGAGWLVGSLMRAFDRWISGR